MADKHYTVSVLEDHVLVEREEDTTVVMSDQAVMIEEVLATCRQSGQKNVLVTGASIKVELSTVDLLQLGTEVANSRLRIAVVEEHDASPEDVSFLENVAWNRGGLIRFFDNEAAAKDWLDIH